MKAAVKTLDAGSAGEVELDDAIFGLEPRRDLIQRMVRYQLLKRMAGTHHVQDRSEITVTGKKMYKQKGTGGARHGDKSVPQWRGGGKAFGPKPRSHAIELPKKVRALALRHALSAKAKAGEILVIDKVESSDGKTKGLKARRSSPPSPGPPATSPTSTCCPCRASTSTTSCAARTWC
jgi:large subunit ribosomal protein L4